MSTSLKLITEASPDVGHGHISRCLGFAEFLQSIVDDVCFCVESDYAKSLIERSTFHLCDSADSAELIIRDLQHGSDAGQVAGEVTAGSRVMLIDDLGPARLEANLVLDALMTPQRAQAYQHSESVNYLYGVKYYPISPRLKMSLSGSDNINNHIPKLLIALGGGDNCSAVLALLRALKDRRGECAVAVLGNWPDARQDLAKFSSVFSHFEHIAFTDQVGNIIRQADVMISKLGLLQFEAFFLGTPCITYEPTAAHVKLQKQLQKNYQNWPVAYVGDIVKEDAAEVISAAIQLMGDQKQSQVYRHTGQSLIDGQGMNRVVDVFKGENYGG